MNRLASNINPVGKPFQLRSSLFHSTPALERKRRTHWGSTSSLGSSTRKFDQYSRSRRKQSLFHNFNDFAKRLFQNFQSDKDEYNEPSGQRSSWFRPSFREDGNKKWRSRHRKSHAYRRGFEFCGSDDDDIEFEEIFRSASGGNKYFHWTFTMGSYPRSSGYYSGIHGSRNGWKYEDYDSSGEYDRPSISNMTSDRLALGLNSSGPLTLDDIKTAYRACALKWHPDRHQGSSKAIAEEKFKICSAAYKSLCDKIVV